MQETLLMPESPWLGRQRLEALLREFLRTEDGSMHPEQEVLDPAASAPVAAPARPAEVAGSPLPADRRAAAAGATGAARSMAEQCGGPEAAAHIAPRGRARGRRARARLAQAAAAATTLGQAANPTAEEPQGLSGISDARPGQSGLSRSSAVGAPAQHGRCPAACWQGYAAGGGGSMPPVVRQWCSTDAVDVCRGSDSSTEGDDGITTLVLRQLPAGCTQGTLISDLAGRGLWGTYDFVYLPRDFRSGHTHGYAIINFRTPACARSCIAAYSGLSHPPGTLNHSVTVGRAVQQGFERCLRPFLGQRRRGRARDPRNLPVVFLSPDDPGQPPNDSVMLAWSLRRRETWSMSSSSTGSPPATL